MIELCYYFQRRYQVAETALAPQVAQLVSNREAMGELGIITNVLRASGEEYVFLPGTKYMVLRDLAKHTTDTPRGLGFSKEGAGKLPEGYILKAAGEIGADIDPKGKYAAYLIKNQETIDFLKKNVELRR